MGLCVCIHTILDSSSENTASYCGTVSYQFSIFHTSRSRMITCEFKYLPLLSFSVHLLKNHCLLIDLIEKLE